MSAHDQHDADRDPQGGSAGRPPRCGPEWTERNAAVTVAATASNPGIVLIGMARSLPSRCYKCLVNMPH